MKLIELDEDHRTEIPQIDHKCTVRMPSLEFARICRNLSRFGESMVIACDEHGKLHCVMKLFDSNANSFCFNVFFRILKL